MPKLANSLNQRRRKAMEPGMRLLALSQARRTIAPRAMARAARTAIVRVIFGHHALALADQSLVSAASFLTTIIVSRYTHPSELGFYSIGMSLLASALALQNSLVSLPYSIQRGRSLTVESDHAGCSLMLSALISVLGAIAATAVAVWLSVAGGETGPVEMAYALAAALPFALLRGFGRSFMFAHLRMWQAMWLDIATVACQLFALGALAMSGLVNAATACAAFGAACALTGAVWLYFSLDAFTIRIDRALGAARLNWSLGKWLFLGQLSAAVQTYVVNWLIALVMGAAAAGVYAAWMSIGLFSNPVIIGIGNILTARAVLAYNEGGAARLRRHAIDASLLLGIALAIFCIVVMFVGQDAISWLYHGKEYEGGGRTVTVLSLGILAGAVGMPASNALASMERPHTIALVGFIGAALTALLAWLFMARWGLLGAAYGYLGGNIAGAVGRWIAFHIIASRCASEGLQGNMRE